MKTVKFVSTIGIMEGYGHNNNGETKDFNSLYQEVAKKIFQETNIYISAVSVQSKTLYNTEWGCPKGGEDTYTISGVANPEFITDMEQYKETVRKVILKLKEELKQSTVTLEFIEVEIEYLK